MAITEADLKLRHAQEDSDFATGGGMETSGVVVDGALHNLFDARAELDDVGGRCKIRKVFARVDTDTRDRFQRGHLALTEIPEDPLVSATLISTEDHFDRRADHADYIASYYIPAAKYGGHLYGTQIEGSRTLELWQRTGTALPEIGATYCILEDEGTIAQASQYVRCVDVATRIETFTDGTGDYTKLVVTMTLADRLQQDFHGPEVSRVEPNPSSYHAVLRKTVASAAARYYGAQPLAVAATEGEMVVRIDSPYTQLVPASTAPTAHVDLDPSATDLTLVPSASGTLSVTLAAAFGPNIVLRVGTAILPGSLSVSAGGATLTDRNGTLYSGETAIGLVDYEDGTLTGGVNCPTYNGTKTATFKPAAPLTEVQQTAALQITQGTQSLAYALTLPTSVQPGTAKVAYRAGGSWYELVDGGDGVLRGFDSSFGVAQLRFSTRSMTISLTVLPDVDTWLVITWGSADYCFDRSANTPAPAAIEIITTATPVPNGTVITWTHGGSKSASDDGAGGLTGDATGSIDYAGKTILLRPNVLPPAGTVITVTITPRTQTSETFASVTPDGSGHLPITLAHMTIVPGSIKVEAGVAWDDYLAAYSADGLMPTGPALPATLAFQDDGAGVFQEPAGSTANYAAGTLLLHRAVQFTAKQPIRSFAASWGRFVFAGWTTTTVGGTVSASAVKVSYAYGNAQANVTETHAAAALRVDLLADPATTQQESVVPRSLRLALSGRTYVDAGGIVYDPATPSVGAGTLDYATGRLQITSWQAGGANSPDILALTARQGEVVVDEVTFRAPAAPVQAGSVQIVATDTLGNELTATVDSSGYFAASGIEGRFYFAAGVGRVRFGNWVSASGQSGQPWYDADRVVSGQVWKPKWVKANTIRYNCVTTTYLPADPERIGVEIARLPASGRVPFVEIGDLGIVMDAQYATASSPTAGGTVDVGRENLERIWVRDSTGARVPADRFSANLDTGILTWAAPLDLAGYIGPYKVWHRRIHKAYVASVSIDGRIGLQLPLNADYPMGALFATGIETGDLQGRVERMFVQGIWSSTSPVWANGPIGTVPDTAYDALAHPIEVTNRSSTDSYALVFESSSTFRVVSEHRGVLARAVSINTDYTLLNPVTGDPEFTIEAAGWGSGWAANNVLRLDIAGASFPVEVVLTIQAGVHTVDLDRFTLEFMGDTV